MVSLKFAKLYKENKAQAVQIAEMKTTLESKEADIKRVEALREKETTDLKVSDNYLSLPNFFQVYFREAALFLQGLTWH